MKHLIICLTICAIMHASCKVQQNITYSFEGNVNDSLRAGVQLYERLYQKPSSKLRLCAIVIENSNDYDIYLQEFSSLKKSGLLQLIKTTNRKLVIAPGIDIPVIVPSDNLSSFVKKDKIISIPLGGYYLKIISDKGQLKVMHTAMTY